MATTWYIAPTGNDTTGNGTEGTPYLTVNKCHTVGANGDTVVCAEGTYREYAFTISKTSWTIRAAAGARPIFVATHAYTSWNKTAGLTNVYETAYVSASCWSVWNAFTKLTSTVNTAACDALPNSFYYDNAGDKLYVNIGGGAPTSIEVYDVSNNYALINTGAGLTLDGLTFRYQMQAVDIRAGGSTIVRCVMDYNVGYNTSAAFSLLQITGSTHSITHCRFSGIRSKTTCIILLAASDLVSVAKCRFEAGEYGIDVDGGTHSISECTFTGMANDGVNADAGVIVVDRCIAYDNSHGAYRVNNTADGTFRNCLAYLTYDVPVSGTGAAWGFIVDPGADVNWYHCIAYNLRAATSSSGKDGFLVQTNGAVTAKGCISCANIRGYVVGAIYNPTLDCDYNCAYDNTTSDYVSDWTMGAHDVASNPLFANPGQYDFRLLPTSPCIDAGVFVTGVNEGFRGGAPDIGACEYVRPRGRARCCG